ncbi:MAG: Lrp/AsnC family transcriptional regulator [Rhizobiales bacterium]|nr:Lrp/AsnC family transcriptional regulator [Hyphomicrobiales bacterium]MDQ3560235.1 Lrp/AsnC family transcriptional regulator [Pseudomonadota bacterium]
MARPKLDRYDLGILSALQRDGRMSKVKLAAAVHLTPSPCWERLKRLEDTGVITGYQARIDPKKLGPATVVMVEIELREHAATDFERFESAIRDAPEIIDCQATGGGVDYLMKVVVPDIDAYQRLIDGLLERGLGIARYYSYVVTKSVKEGEGLPLHVLAGGSA